MFEQLSGNQHRVQGDGQNDDPFVREAVHERTDSARAYQTRRNAPQAPEGSRDQSTPGGMEIEPQGTVWRGSSSTRNDGQQVDRSLPNIDSSNRQELSSSDDWRSPELAEARQNMLSVDRVMLDRLEKAFFTGDLQKLMQLVSKIAFEHPETEVQQSYALQAFKKELAELGFSVNLGKPGEITIDNFRSEPVPPLQRLLNHVQMDANTGAIDACVEDTVSKKQTFLFYNAITGASQVYGTDMKTGNQVTPDLNDPAQFASFIAGDAIGRQQEIERRKIADRAAEREQRKVEAEARRAQEEADRQQRELDRELEKERSRLEAEEQKRKSEQNK
jgi:hypothetical protein